MGTIVKYPKPGEVRMLIMRGLPASGKTYTALSIAYYADDHCQVVRVSADEFFYNEDEEYHFNPALLPQAHGDCFKKAVTWASDDPTLPTRSRLIIVDNTNISSWEISPYMAIAQAYNIPCSILTIDCGSELRLRRNSERSPDRKVPEVVLANMAMRFFEEKLPPWWDNVITKSF